MTKTIISAMMTLISTHPLLNLLAEWMSYRHVKLSMSEISHYLCPKSSLSNFPITLESTAILQSFRSAPQCHPLLFTFLPNLPPPPPPPPTLPSSPDACTTIACSDQLCFQTVKHTTCLSIERWKTIKVHVVSHGRFLLLHCIPFVKS